MTEKNASAQKQITATTKKRQKKKMTAVYKTASARNGENDTIQPDRLFTYSDRSLYQDEKNTHTSKSFFIETPRSLLIMYKICD